MKKIGLRTKIEASMVILLLLTVGIGSVMSVTRTITDTSDTIDTYIRNSNGNYWAATGANIQLAIWDLNSTTGEVRVPAGYYDIDIINISEHVTVIGAGSYGYDDAQVNAKGGTQFNLSDNTDTIILGGGRLWSCKLQCADGYTGTAINVSAYGGGYGDQDELEKTPLILQDVCVFNGVEGDYSISGKGVVLWSHYGGDWLHSFAIGPGNTFSDIVIMGFEYGLSLIGNTDSYVNANMFSNMEIYGNGYDIYINGSCSGNTFSNIEIEGRANSSHAIFIDDGALNQFRGIHIFDWDEADGESLVIHGDDNTFSGFLAIDVNGINITGVGNKLDLTARESNVYTMYPTGYKDGTHILNTLEDVTLYYDAKIVFMPGTYDIDCSIAGTNAFYEFYFSPGAIFEVNEDFVGTYVIYLGKNSLIHGRGVIDGKNVAGVSAVYVIGNTTIDGLTFKNFDSDTLYVKYGSRTLIKDCIIKDGGDAGIYLWLSNNCTIQNCFIHNMVGRCIEFIGSIDCNVNNNNLYDAGTDYIVYCNADSHYNVISENKIYGSPDSGINLAAGCNNCSVIDNHFSNCVTYGVRNKGTDCIVTGNHIDNCGTAIKHDAAVRPIIKDNIGYDYDSLQDDYIWNSEGKYYSVTEGADITDDLQSAIDICGDNGEVSIPEGTFTIDNSRIVMDDNIWLHGAGEGITILKQADDANCNPGVIQCDEINNWTISDFSIDGNWGNNPTGYHGIDIYGCNDFNVYNIYINGTSESGIHISYSPTYNPSNRGSFSNIKIRNATQGISLGGLYNSSFTDCEVWDDRGWCVDSSNVQNSTFDGIRVHDSDYGMKVTGASYGNYNNDYSNIILTNIGTSDATFKVQYTHYCNFDGIIINDGTGMIVYGGGYMCTYNNFNNIVIKNVKDYALSISANYNNLANIMIDTTTTYGIEVSGEGNHITNLNITNQGTYSLIENCNYLSIIGGSISHAGSSGGNGYGFVIKNSNYVTISYVDISNCPIDAIDTSIGGANTNFSFDHCHILDNGGYGIDLHASDSWFYIDHNWIYGNGGTIDEAGITYLIEKNFGVDL